MLYVVTGASGSGKSEYAEQLLMRLWREAGGGKKIYLATMLPYGEEGKRRIARHREMRREKAFQTEECYTGVKAFAQKILSCEESPFVLLECMSNLIANELFEADGAGEQTVQEVTEGIRLLVHRSKEVVAVTNEVCSESAQDTPEMCRYKQILSEVNRRLTEQAEEMTEVVYGIPLPVKSGKDRVSVAETESCGICSRESKERRSRESMHLIIGGAYQGKLAYAKGQYPEKLRWVDGAVCSLSEIPVCDGMYHLEEYIKRWMKQELRREDLQEVILENLIRLTEKNPGVVLICNEIGCGLVPIDPFERAYRENVGRICTALASRAVRVDRVVCGIGVVLKSKKNGNG